MKRKVCVIVTARPSYSRIKTTLKAIQGIESLELQLVMAGSALLERYGNVSKLVEADGFKISAKVLNVVEGENLLSMAKTTGIGIMELSTVFDNLKPDVVVTVADRYETLATAISASYMNIPLAHIQGGEVTGSIDEKVRHAITKLSDLHYVSNASAAERVRRMGENDGRIHISGCPSIDIAKAVYESPEFDFEPFVKYGGVGDQPDLSPGYIVVLQHPVTTEHSSASRQILETLEAVDSIGLPTLWFWPNVDAGSDSVSKGIREYREVVAPKHIHFFRNMESQDFLRLLANSRGIVGNSSVAIRECSFLGVPAVNIGSRQSGRDRGSNVVDVDCDRKEIESAIKFQFDVGKYQSNNLYGDGNAGEFIAKSLSLSELTYEKKLSY